MNELAGRSVLITGGSRGLGKALAEQLATRGARVVLVARGAAELERTVSELRNSGAEVHGVVADIADKEATYRITGQAAALVGPIDVLVNNASTLGPVPLRLLLDTDCEDLQRTLEVNVLGPFRLSKALLGAMVLRESGLVVNVSSDAAVEAYPRWGAYSASKAAFDHLMRVWAAELEATGVRVVGVDPGEMDTRMHADAVPDADRNTLASPVAIARRVATLIARPELYVSGTRVRALEIPELEVAA